MIREISYSIICRIPTMKREFIGNYPKNIIIQLPTPRFLSSKYIRIGSLYDLDILYNHLNKNERDGTICFIHAFTYIIILYAPEKIAKFTIKKHLRIVILISASILLDLLRHGKISLALYYKRKSSMYQYHPVILFKLINFMLENSISIGDYILPIEFYRCLRYCENNENVLPIHYKIIHKIPVEYKIRAIKLFHDGTIKSFRKCFKKREYEKIDPSLLISLC